MGDVYSLWSDVESVGDDAVGVYSPSGEFSEDGSVSAGTESDYAEVGTSVVLAAADSSVCVGSVSVG